MDLFYSPLARLDLDEIRDYISRNLCNPSAAAETVNAILDGAESLEDFPFVGTVVHGLPSIADEYRFLPVRNYLVFYRVTLEGVFVDRILYKRRDYLPLLGLQ
jgi:plasmid stabilization system protein ParE